MLAAFLPCLALAMASSHAFEAWAERYGKVYASDERAHRYGVWERNSKMVEAHNRDPQKKS
jgi:hypothetical protein